MIIFGKKIKGISIGNSPVKKVYYGNNLVYQMGYPVGTQFKFGYTGNVQQQLLLPGKYKLQVWGAQGGDTTHYNGIGSKGGYSEGILSLDESTNVYIFVGGRGGSSGNGGWNCGGGTNGQSSSEYSGEKGISYPACGGGATDIALVSSSMNYVDKVNNRSDASLLSRFIVAGAGAGASAYYKKTTQVVEKETLVNSGTASFSKTNGTWNWYFWGFAGILKPGVTYKAVVDNLPSNGNYTMEWWDSQGNYLGGSAFLKGKTFTIPDAAVSSNFAVNVRVSSSTASDTWSCRIYSVTSETEVQTYNGRSNGSQYGGGISGGGSHPGTQSGASYGGSFGKGCFQNNTNYRYVSGGGGAGWYGGGEYQSDDDVSAVNWTGGGSGFVNTAENAQYRPSGYTGLQLDSGSTKSGNTYFPSINDGTEYGHSGNGYCIITTL